MRVIFEILYKKKLQANVLKKSVWKFAAGENVWKSTLENAGEKMGSLLHKFFSFRWDFDNI